MNAVNLPNHMLLHTCPQDSVEAVKKWRANTGFDYEVRGVITIMRLDTLIAGHDVQVTRDSTACPFAGLRNARNVLRMPRPACMPVG